MSRRRLIVLTVGLGFVLAGCFYVLALSVRKLPPNVVEPNSKPALNLPTQPKSALRVNDGPVEQTGVGLSTDSSSNNNSAAGSPAAQDQQSSAGSTTVAPKDIGAVLPINLSSGKDNQPVTLISGLQNTLLNITGGLN